jgi:plastocyanin
MTLISPSRRRGGFGAVALAVLALTALALAAPGQERAAARGNGGAEDKVVRVSIANFAFHPHTLKVDRGTRVAFANESGVTHTATRKGSFSTGHIAPGTSVAIRFKQKGTFAYHCEIHPFMHGKIVVQ